MNLEIIIIPEMANASNCYIIYSDKSKKGVLIDPGSEPKLILKNIEEKDINIVKIILTHGHGDHIFAVREMKEELNVPVAIHQGDFNMLNDGHANFTMQMFREAIEIEADEILKDGETIKIEDGFEIKVIHTPGHTPGGVCLKVGNVIITGDTLFAGSIGRTDFPGGNYQEIIASIKDKLLVYPDETIILPGHGGHSTIGDEKRINPFIK